MAIITRPGELPRFCSQLEKDTAPPTPPESIRSFRSDSVSTSIFEDPKQADISRTVTCTSSHVQSPREYLLDWIIKFLGIATAILFGIWAPVSYSAQVDGNKNDDEAQARLVERVEELVDEIKGLKSKMDFDGALRAWEFCDREERRALSACESLTSTLKLDSVLRNLASIPKKHKPSSRRGTEIPASTSTPLTTTTTTTPAEDGYETSFPSPAPADSSTANSILSREVPSHFGSPNGGSTLRLGGWDSQSSHVSAKSSQPRSQPASFASQTSIPGASASASLIIPSESFGPPPGVTNDDAPFLIPTRTADMTFTSTQGHANVSREVPGQLVHHMPIGMATRVGFLCGVVVVFGLMGGWKILNRMRDRGSIARHRVQRGHACEKEHDKG